MEYQQINKNLTVLKNFYGAALIGVIVMVLLGGYTRLTGSGLSMVDWDLYRDLLPPRGREAWMVLFDQYKTSPEFKLVNSWMSLKDFKRIFWLEYIHRVMGRLLGVIFIIPIILTFLKPSLKEYRIRTLTLFGFGALQGAMGWYMVKSGLVKDPAVSHLRLAAHLSIAFFTGACLYWTVMQISNRIKVKTPHTCHKLKFLKLLMHNNALIPSILIVLTVTYGAFVAGLKAGLLYNEFPLMGGHFMPDDLFSNQSHLMNFTYNPVAVQWVHRILALSTLAIGLLWVRHTWRTLISDQLDSSRLCYQLGALKFFSLVMILQVLLGIATLLYHVPLNLAVIHQANAFFLILSGLRVLFVLSPGFVISRDENLSRPGLYEA